MLHRIFIAINLPESVKKELLAWQEKWPELPIRWATQENLHITLEFLGGTSDEELDAICGIVKEVASRHHSFPVELTKIRYGPPKSPPRMIWVEGPPAGEAGERSQEFISLKKDLESSLANLENLHFVPEDREFSPHITLGRLRQWEFQRMDSEERPEVEEDISLQFEARSIEVMESKLKRSGAEYSILQSFPFTAL